MAHRCSFLVIFAAFLMPGPGQAEEGAAAESDAASSDKVIEEIIVTGSRLPRRDFVALSPIATVDSGHLAASGQPTLENTLNQMPQVAPDFGRTSNNPGNGKAHMNLRDLGAGRSLVLVNSQRVAPSGIGSAVDINTLPKVLIDRVEIITGGASTVYGSDALAGVANVILRNDFDGVGIDMSSYVTEAGDANINDINLTWGHNFDNGKGNVTIYAGYLDREHLFGDAREFSSVVLEDMWDGTVGESGSPRVPAGSVFFPQVDLGDGPVQLTFDTDGNPRAFDFDRDKYNYAPDNYLQTPLQRTSAGLIFDYDLTLDSEIYGMLSWTNNTAERTLAPTPAADFFVINPDNPVLTPATAQVFADQLVPIQPGLVGMLFSRRTVELGPRIQENDNDYFRVAAGLRGRINDNWDFDAWVTYTKNDEVMLHRNDASYSRMQQGLLVDPATGECFDPSGGCVPLNLFGEGNLSAEGAEFIRLAPLYDKTTREQKLVSAFVRGVPFELRGAAVTTAIGVEWRSDSGRYFADEAFLSGDSMGFFPFDSVDGTESVYEVYAEAAVPLAQGAAWAEYFGFELGGRLSWYDNAGNVETWKLGAEWQLPVAVRFRTMLQRSVRAPNLAEGYTVQSESFGSFVGANTSEDPCSASRDPLNSGLADACVATGIPLDQLGIYEATAGTLTRYLTGGNPALEPEVGDTFTAGVVFDFDWLDGAQLSVDYFDIEIEGTIGGLDAIGACYDVSNTGQMFCDHVIRDPVSYNVIEIHEFNINQGGLKTSGIDTMFSFTSDLPAGLALFADAASFAADITWTHTLDNTYQNTPFSSVVDCAGTFSWPCFEVKNTMTYANDRVLAGLSYYSGELDMRLSLHWIGGTVNGLIPNGWVYGLEGIDFGNPSVKDMLYADLGIGYRVTENIAARLDIANLTDEDPPLQLVWSGNTDPTMYDVFGRSYTLSLSMEF